VTEHTGHAAQDEMTEPEPTTEIPSFLQGGRVERTGIALVHEGEYIVPAEDSEAAVTYPGQPETAGTVLSYEFPVRVEVVGELTESHIHAVARHVFDELDTALRSQA
jgi:hypothetical protein